MGLIHIKTIRAFIIALLLIGVSNNAISQENFEKKENETEVKKEEEKNKKEEPSNSEDSGDDKKEKKEDKKVKKIPEEKEKKKEGILKESKNHVIELNTTKNKDLEKLKENYNKKTNRATGNTMLKIKALKELIVKTKEVKKEAKINKDKLKITTDSRKSALNSQKSKVNSNKNVANENKNKQQKISQSRQIQRNIKHQTNKIINKKPAIKPVKKIKK